MPEALLNVLNQDGSRLFGKLPMATSAPTVWQLCARIRALPGVSHSYAVMLRDRDYDDLLIGFMYAGYDFFIRERDGAYCFLVQQAACGDAVLRQILAHCRTPAHRSRKRQQGAQSGRGAGVSRGGAQPPRQHEHPW